MGDEDGGLAVFLDQPDELGAQRPARHLVQRRERLVAEQDIGVGRKGARDRDALPHAAGQRMRIVVLVPAQAERGRASACAVARRLLGGHIEHLEPELDILHAPCATAAAGRPGTRSRSCRGTNRSPEGIAAVDPHRAGGRLGQAGDHVEDRRFAAAGLAEQRQHLARPDLEIEPVDRDIGRRRAALAERLSRPGRG